MRISDWSSDVCSSDLLGIGNRFVEAALRAAQGTGADVEPPAVEPRHREAETVALGADAVFDRHLHIVEDHLRGGGGVPAELALLGAEDGRASGRESVCQYVLIPVVAVTLKKKT